ncbi:MAG: hypothetical protein KAH46_25340, partial [Mycobacterium sp.]|nr:hypothetical protein [Mycobacterium sp.]
MITTTGLTTIAEPPTPAATGVATTTGATSVPGAPTTVTNVAAGTTLALPCPSTSAKETVLTPAVFEVNVTEANNCSYSATDADPV